MGAALKRKIMGSDYKQSHLEGTRVVPIDRLTLEEAEQLTGIPSAVIQALADCGEIPAERREGQVYLGKAALLGWCHLFAKILTAVVTRQRSEEVGGGVSARNLVWMAQAGLLKGKDRIRL